MATTTNYSWTTPDDTDLVKDGAAAIRTLGSAIDTTVFNNAAAALAKSVIDAEGDLIVGDAADAVQRLAIGSDGNVLTVDTTVDGKIKWAAQGLADNYTLINAGGTALTGATAITVSGISNKNSLMILVDQASSVNASSSFTVTFNADTGSNYGTLGLVVTNTTISNSGSSFGDNNIPVAKMSSSAAAQCSFNMVVGGTNATGRKWFNVSSACDLGTGSVFRLSTGWYSGSSAISSVTITSSTGNFDAGTIYVYGG